MSRIARLVAGCFSGSIAKDDIDYLVVLGSSTPFMVYGTSIYGSNEVHNARAAMCSYGIDVPIINKAVSGAKIADLDANVTAYLTSLSIPVDKKVACLINVGTNDIGSTSYSSMLPATIAAMESSMISAINKIKAFNYIPILSTSNSRLGWDAVYQSWADGFYKPIIQQHCPKYYANGEAVFDLYTLYETNGGIANWYHSDGVHPGPAGTPVYQQYNAQKISTYLNAKPLSPNNSIIFSFGFDPLYIGGINRSSVNVTSITSIVDTRGNVIPGATHTNDLSAWANSSRGNAGNHDVSLSNNDIQKQWAYKASAANTHTLNLGAAYANATGTLNITFNTITANRGGSYTSNGVTVTIPQSNVGVPVVSVPFTFDASGSHVLTVNVGAGGFSGISGYEYVFN